MYLLSLQNPIPPKRTASSARKKFSSPCGFTDRFLFGGAAALIDPDDEFAFTLLLLLALVLASFVEFCIFTGDCMGVLCWL